MLFSSRCFVAAALLALPLSSFAADASRDYDAVRRIALRDRKVQDAFAKANQKLDDKIVEIDPAQAAYVKAHPSGRTSGGVVANTKPSATKAVPAKPTKSAAKNAAAPAAAGRKTHVVKAGETFTSIAAKYGVSAESIQGTNRIRDERKLKVGQTLVIPAKK
jgi:LysM repeat protein